MKKPIIHRYAYLPNCNIKTQEYSWRKLKVVKVWCQPTYAGLQINYVLENCARFNQYTLYTENEIKNMCPKRHHNFIIKNLMSNMHGFISQTIFSPATEQQIKSRGSLELMRRIEDSRKEIQDCINNDYIIGEENVQEQIDFYYDKKDGKIS